jgi:hypothetical protein
MKTFNFTLEDLGLEIFHDQWKRVNLWSMEESLRLEHLETYQWEHYLHNQKESLVRRKEKLRNKRSRKVYDLRQAGCTYKVIGDLIGVTPSRVREIFLCYKRALKG